MTTATAQATAGQLGRVRHGSISRGRRKTLFWSYFFLILFVIGYWYTGLMSLLQGRFSGVSFNAGEHTKPFPVGV